VFYRINNVPKGVSHCVFSDNGCPACPNSKDGEWVRGAVAHSIHKFIQSIKSGYFRKAEFSLPGVDSSLLSLFVNMDDPDYKSALGDDPDDNSEL